MALAPFEPACDYNLTKCSHTPYNHPILGIHTLIGYDPGPCRHEQPSAWARQRARSRFSRYRHRPYEKPSRGDAIAGPFRGFVPVPSFGPGPPAVASMILAARRLSLGPAGGERCPFPFPRPSHLARVGRTITRHEGGAAGMGSKGKEKKKSRATWDGMGWPYPEAGTKSCSALPPRQPAEARAKSVDVSPSPLLPPTEQPLQRRDLLCTRLCSDELAY